MIYQCDTCQQFRNSQQKETLIQHEIPKQVWSKVGTDLFIFLNKIFLVVVDYTSKYFEVIQLPDGRASTVINYTKSIFARHGIPHIVISDNGSQYTSYRYKQFAKQWNFQHDTSSPEFPQSNGLVERTIQTIKKTLYKCKLDGSDPYLALLALRTVKNKTNSSAASALMNRELRTCIPKMISSHDNYIKEHYDKNARDLPPLHINDTVRFQENNRWGRVGKIVDIDNSPRSYIIHTDKDTTIRRNRRHLIPSSSKLSIERDDEELISNHPSQPSDILEEENSSDVNENEITQQTVPVETNKPSYQTRSGRTIRRPKRYDS